MNGFHLSRYAIISSHTYHDKKNGQQYRLLYLSKAARVFILPLNTVDKLASGNLEDIDSIVLNSFENTGIMTIQSTEQELTDVLESLQPNLSRRVFVLMPTAACNMDCQYCGQQHSGFGWSQEIEETVLKRVTAAAADTHTSAVEIRWYGGEPLLAFDRMMRVSKILISSCREHGTSYHATISTNGSLLTPEVIDDLYFSAGIKHITVTIDGYGESHNTSRYMKNDAPTYEQIVGCLKTTAKRSASYPDLLITARINITKRDAPHITSLLDDLAPLSSFSGFNIQFSPVYDWGHSNSNIMLTIEELRHCTDKWLQDSVNRHLRTEILPTSIRHDTCIAVGQNKELIGPLGSIYYCTEHPLVPRYDPACSLGPVLSDSSPRPSGPFDSLHANLLTHQSRCRVCKFLPVCGGGCPIRWKEGIQKCPTFITSLEERFDLLAKTASLSIA